MKTIFEDLRQLGLFILESMCFVDDGQLPLDPSQREVIVGGTHFKRRDNHIKSIIVGFSTLFAVAIKLVRLNYLSGLLTAMKDNSIEISP